MLWYSLEAPRRGEYPQHMFSWRNKKDINIFPMKKSALSVAMDLSLKHDLVRGIFYYFFSYKVEE